MKIHGPTETKHGRSQSYETAEALDKARPSNHTDALIQRRVRLLGESA
jgi:hypothetical protein